jgi:hypothetical protein
MASVTEVGSNIDRINRGIAAKPVTLSLFVIKNEEPTLIETSYRRALDEVIDAVTAVIDSSMAGPSAPIPVERGSDRRQGRLDVIMTEAAGQEVPDWLLVS